MELERLGIPDLRLYKVQKLHNFIPHEVLPKLCLSTHIILVSSVLKDFSRYIFYQSVCISSSEHLFAENRLISQQQEIIYGNLFVVT